VQPRHHYELAFQEYLRARRIPYVAVNEARKTLVPPGGAGPGSLKSFDFVLYGPKLNLLAEIKGRKIPAPAPGRPARAPRLQSWATQDDIDALLAWERLFGDGFRAALVFVYWCQEQPPAPLFEDLFECRGRWYAVRTVLAGAYAASMKPRSTRWRTVHMPAAAFDRLSQPLGALTGETGGGGAEQALHPAGGPVASVP
jgi:hypothetical protein